MVMLEAVQAMSDKEDMASALVTAGYGDERIELVTSGYLLEVGALDAPETLLGMWRDWRS